MTCGFWKFKIELQLQDIERSDICVYPQQQRPASFMQVFPQFQSLFEMVSIANNLFLFLFFWLYSLPLGVMKYEQLAKRQTKCTNIYFYSICQAKNNNNNKSHKMINLTGEWKRGRGKGLLMPYERIYKIKKGGSAVESGSKQCALPFIKCWGNFNIAQV